MEEKRKRKQLTEDSRLNSMLWELAELLAEIATKDEKPAGEAIKHQPNDLTDSADEATAGSG